MNVEAILENQLTAIDTLLDQVAQALVTQDLDGLGRVSDQLKQAMLLFAAVKSHLGDHIQVQPATFDRIQALAQRFQTVRESLVRLAAQAGRAIDVLLPEVGQADTYETKLGSRPGSRFNYPRF
ncbi:MAG: hypothetical protein JOY84_03785 [Curvibacter sp.]|nr:hypothetical protein [Curvibacter sp.]